MPLSGCAYHMEGMCAVLSPCRASALERVCLAFGRRVCGAERACAMQPRARGNKKSSCSAGGWSRACMGTGEVTKSMKAMQASAVIVRPIEILSLYHHLNPKPKSTGLRRCSSCTAPWQQSLGSATTSLFDGVGGISCTTLLLLSPPNIEDASKTTRFGFLNPPI